jgi:DNA (cytosine-5)-methyltransferase 1
VEIEAFQNFNMVAAMESGLVDKAPIWTDLKTFDAQPFRNKLHGIIGGYPCQGESLAGKRELWNDNRFLWPHIEDIMRTTRPFWGFFENVAGHLSGSFPYVLDSLRAMGYKVECGLYSAEEAGAPHQRKRLFILALDDTTNRGFWKCKESKNENRKSGSRERRKLENGFKGSSESEMDNTSGYRSESLNEISTGRYSIKPSGKKISNTNCKRSQRFWEQRNWTGPVGLCNRKRFNEKWPAGPQEKQHPWEAKRTVKPGVGCTVNGYNFRTELLRQYGNGVVSQTAEIAFRELLNKHNY